MKNLLCSASFLIATTLSAIAADEVQDAPASFNWSGGYAGVYAGWLGQNVGTEDIDGLFLPPFQLEDIDTSDFTGGVLAGWNWQSGNFVFGVEGDIGLGGSGSSLVDAVNLDETVEWESDWVASVRGRVGLARNNWLFYGTGGVAITDATYGYLNLDDTRTIVESDTRTSDIFTGFVVGLGADWAVTDKAIARFEYMHYEFGSKTLEAAPGFAPVEYSPSMDTVRVALILKF